MTLSLKNNLRKGLGLSFGVLILSSMASFISIKSLINNPGLTTQSNATTCYLNNLLFVLKEAETGQRDCLLARKEVEEKEKILPRTIYIAPADYPFLMEKDLSFSLDYSEKVNFSRPAIAVTFMTAAEVFGPQLVYLLLSGSNADGVKGLSVVSRHQGRVLVQTPMSAQVA